VNQRKTGFAGFKNGKMKLAFIGIDSWDRLVYKDENGGLWKDVTLGSDSPELYSACNNDFDGEPDMPITKEWEIVKSDQMQYVSAS